MMAVEAFDGLDPRLERCLAIRRVVFIEEQQVPEDLEVDGLDPECEHFLALGADGDLGAARLRLKSPTVGKAERVAVHAFARGRGVGVALMVALHQRAKELGCSEVILGAQNTALGFYERLGYEVYGPEFMDAGIPHHMMRLGLD